MALQRGWEKKVSKDGSGDSPVKGQWCKMHYVGTLLNGNKFDSSRDKGRAFIFQLGMGQVIKGWDQGVATMKKGERAILKCSPECAYGARGHPPVIPENSTLNFDVELLDFATREQDIHESWNKTIIKEGSGPKPRRGQTCVMHYTGTFPDGQKFDSSRDRGRLFRFQIGVGKVIKGWDAGVMEMQVGERAQLVCPYYWAYGKNGIPGTIPRYQTLHFDVELFSVE